MKKTVMTLMLAFAILSLQAQTRQNSGNEIQTILPKGKGMGIYGALSLGYTQLDSKDALISGARGGIILGQSLGLGIAGYGFVNDINFHHLTEGIPVRNSLAGGYGGFFIEPVIGSRKAVHVSFPVLFGAGGLSLIERGKWNPLLPPGGGWDYFYHPEERDYDAFLIVEPAAEIELNFTRFLRVAGFVSKRFTTDIALAGISSDVLDGTTIGVTVKLGKF
ncbi:MAG: hypothetical protein ACOZDD_11745 [Bacteroidota bacterium]